MGSLIFWCVFVIIVGICGLVWIGEKGTHVPWEREISIGKRREIAYDDAISEEEMRNIINNIDWDNVEPNKTYELYLSLGLEDVE